MLLCPSNVIVLRFKLNLVQKRIYTKAMIPRADKTYLSTVTCPKIVTFTWIVG